MNREGNSVKQFKHIPSRVSLIVPITHMESFKLFLLACYQFASCGLDLSSWK